MTLEELCNIGNEPAQPLGLIDIYTNEKIGVTLYLHQIRSRRGAMAKNAFELKKMEAMTDKDNLDENGDLKKELIGEYSLEMVASLIEKWDGVDAELTTQNVVEVLKNSDEISIQVSNFVTKSGKPLRKSEKER